MTATWLRTLLREAAWPGIAVFVGHAVLGGLFGHEPYVDPASHLLGGGAAAYFFARVPDLLPRWFGRPNALVLYLMAFGLTAAVAVFWELGELGADLLRSGRFRRTLENTMRDLCNGMLGATIFIAGDLLVRRRAAPEPRSASRPL